MCFDCSPVVNAPSPSSEVEWHNYKAQKQEMVMLTQMVQHSDLRQCLFYDDVALLLKNEWFFFFLNSFTMF